MNFSDIYFSANEQLQLKNLTPLTEEIYNSLNKDFWESPFSTYSYQEWKSELEKHGYNVTRIYKNTNESSMRAFFYVGEYFTVEMMMLDPSWLTSPMVITSIKADEHGKNLLEKKDYLGYFFPEWNLFSIDYFIRYYRNIETSELWEVFKIVYTFSNYGFYIFPEEVLEYVFNYADNSSSKALLKSLNVVDSEGYVTIYRGVGKRSTGLEKAYSWTLSEAVASKFANHFEQGTIYQAKVRFDSIIDYDNDREEEEVLVRYKDIEELKEV